MSDSRPNVLLLLTDQERYDLTGPDGTAETPSIDRLAAEGARFTRAFTPISICSSARASILTGRFPHSHGVLNNVHERDALSEGLSPSIPTFGERLHDAGYRSTLLGKWHVSRIRGPSAYGFESLEGSDDAHDERLECAFREYRRELGVEPDGGELTDAIYTDHPEERTLVAATTDDPIEATRPYYLAERTIEHLEAWAETDGDAPQLHRTDFLGPHHPYAVPEPYASMYDPDELDPHPSYDETFEDKPRVHEAYLDYRGVDGFDWDTWAEVVAKYRGFATLVDEQIGRVLDAADELGVAEETLTVHTADHGDFVGNHRQFNKGPLMYDDTYHIPLHVRWPGVVDPGTVRDELVSLVDLAPTFLDVGGAEVPGGVHGRSLRPLLDGDDPNDWRDGVFAEYHGDEFGLYSQRMLRTDRYKFVYNVPDRNELYDLERDPHELTNLVEHPEYRDLRRELESRLLERMRETDDVIVQWTARVLGR